MDPVDQVRRFNRLVTQRVGALHDRYLGRRRPLGESRLLYEIGSDPDGAELRALRTRLGIDSGYLSRLVRSLERHDLVRTSRSAQDRRVRRAILTPKGRREHRALDRLSDELATAMLAPLSDNQRVRLTTAMHEVERLLRLSGLRIHRTDPAGPAACRCLERYYAELAERFDEGFDVGTSIPTDAPSLRPPRGAFLIADADGDPVACGALMTQEPEVGYIRRMWVDPTMRGLGLGRRMLAALEDQACELGMHTVRLETNRALDEAMRLYRSAGYTEIEPFNDERYAHHWFEKRLAE